MLQIVANLRNIIVSERPISGLLVMPSCVVILLEAVNSIVYFKPFENEMVKEWLKQIPSIDHIIKFVNEIGFLFLCMIGFLALILILLFLKLMSKKIDVIKNSVSKILSKLMWGSIIRFILQGYLQIAVSSLHSIQYFEELKLVSQIFAIVMIAITILAPLTSSIFMSKF